MQKKHFYRFPALFFLMLSLLMTSCGLRLYNYTMPPLQSLVAPIFPTSTCTPTLLVNQFLTQTAQPAFTNTPITVSPIPSSTLNSLPSQEYFKLTEQNLTAGEAIVLINSRLEQQVLVRLQGPAEKSFYLPQAGQVTVSLPAGTYEFWLIIPGQESRHGEKTFPSGYSEWVFSRSEDLLSTPTPRWDTRTPGSDQ